MEGVILLVLCIFTFSAAVEGAVNYPAVNIPDSTHPCQRQCSNQNSPMLCEYTFDVHWYLTMSKACHKCPFNETDCLRPYCVYGDGHRRAIVAINRQHPGPMIEVCEGDTVEVTVNNMLGDGAGACIHWHGQHQKNSQYMDGACFVTQCAIPENDAFMYQFKPDPTGTYWYHSHIGFQRSDGLAGPFIIHPYMESDPHYAEYDHDCADSPSGDCEVMIHFNAWYNKVAMERFAFRMNWGTRTFPTSMLINGQSQKFPVPDIGDLDDTELTPWPVINLTHGKRYLFRVIDIGHDDCPKKHFIEGHRLQAAYADGHAVETTTVDVIGFYPGERYDYILDTNQAAVGNYWIKVLGMVDCAETNASAFAILRYDGAPDADPTGDRMADDTTGVFLNPVMNSENEAYPTFWNEPKDTQNILAYWLNSTENVDYTNQVVDETYYISMDFNRNDNTKYNDPVYYPIEDLPPQLDHTTPVLNNITIKLPKSPLISQLGDIDPSTFCNSSTVDMQVCTENLCICTHYIHFDLGKTIELIFVNEGFGGEDNHPMHIHGYAAWLMGMEVLGENVYLSEVQQMHNDGTLKMKYTNPSYRDTFQVPDGGYTVVRFVADNPGMWFIHCHVDVHLSQGMGLVMGIGDQSDLPPIPTNFPKCGDWAPSGAPANDAPANDAPAPAP